jgi:hypothetical protein
MQVSKRSVVAMLSTAALAGSAVPAMTALGHGASTARAHRARTVLLTTMAPSMPSDPMIHGVSPGAAPWVLRKGSARLRRDGRLVVRLRGLVIPSPPGTGTPGPVMTVNASLYCGADMTATGTTHSVRISRRGNARIHGRLSLPSKCLAPVLLVHPNGNAGLYIAASGFGH